MHVRNLCEFVNGPLDKYMQNLCSSALCIVKYGTIKIYAVQIYAICTTRIIRINKSQAEICRFTI